MTARPPAPARLGVVRYMGNKDALLPRLVEQAASLAPSGTMVVDPMAGSHAVSHALKRSHVIASSDVQHYSAVIGRAFVDNVTVRKVGPSVLDALAGAARRHLESDAVGFLEGSFSDTYLGGDQCRHLDALRAAVDAVLPEDRPERWLALSALMTAACRAQASPGHFAQFLPPDHPRTRKLREIDVFRVALEALESFSVEPGRPGSVSRAVPWRVLVARHAKELRHAALWYLDPPYTRDQYSRFYHFLETLVRADRPELRHGARYRTDRFRSDFCSPRRAAAELADLFTAVARVSPDARVLLSYSSRGLLGREELVAAALPGHALVDVQVIPHEYSTQGKGKLSGVEEWLLSFTPVSR